MLGNYLRVRGEYVKLAFAMPRTKELPPRTRRIRDRVGIYGHSQGTTSAYAENTHQQSAPARPHRNYLRVRGEYSTSFCTASITSELPPRTRRIHVLVSSKETPRGTTSAYAENTRPGQGNNRAPWNYLRVRGEYGTVFTIVHGHLELPPRTRRIQHAVVAVPCSLGTTSAYAENTSQSLPKPSL